MPGGLPEKLLVDVRVEREAGGRGECKLLETGRGGGGFAARRSAMIFAAQIKCPHQLL
jgi:hypothetical protein